MKISIAQLRQLIKESTTMSESLPKGLQKRAARNPHGKVTNVDLANYVYKHSEKFFGGHEVVELVDEDLQTMPELLDLIKLTTNDVNGFLDAWSMLLEDE